MTESKDQDNSPEKGAGPSGEEITSEGATPDENSEGTKKQTGDARGIEAPDEPSGQRTSEAGTAGEGLSEEMKAVEDFDLNLLLDIPLEITVELGRAQLQIQELLELGTGSTVRLSKLEGEPVDILANNKLIARGEVVLQNKKYGIRITEITSRMNRIKTLS